MVAELRVLLFHRTVFVLEYRYSSTKTGVASGVWTVNPRSRFFVPQLGTTNMGLEPSKGKLERVSVMCSLGC